MGAAPFNALLPAAGSSASGAVASATAFGYGPTFYVDTVHGSLASSGRTWQRAFQTMGQAFDALAALQAQRTKSGDNANIFVQGVVAEQLLAPLGVSGVKITGVSGGNNRHDNGTRWKEAATAGNAPLCELREQGWEFHHLLMVPQTAYAAVKLHREESATYPDASHAVFEDVKFIGNVAITTAGGIGIEDYGGMHHVLIQHCEFANLVSAIANTGGSVAAPLRNVIRDNIFQLNTNDITFNGSGCVVQDNQFLTPYNVTTHPNTVNLAFTATATYPNRVVNNVFADAAANVVIAKGYKPNTGDVWRNYVTDTAAYVVAVPA